ncbi:EamA family transporter RarD [Algimonas porphyrae]|uniref:Permease n=1 Tax=Algimonas porphyrae TaxID=1128113 RepID=A0ABQ5UZ00_9PROT|nr:EamA family transporter RarD [Algimonas porphyrae]GLQ20082.1 permease [Algimonas porphyrae]
MERPQQTDSRAGLISGLSAYFMWGLFPIYFVATKAVPATEILAHRILWSLPFGLLILLFRRQIGDTIRAIRHPKTLALLALASVALAANWGVYIYAIQIEQIFQGSLGYYINPLIYVLVAVLFFGERLTRLQSGAIALAFVGVMVLTVYGGQFPVISLFLAASFTTYGVLRKLIDVGAMPGLFIEVLVLILPAIAYLVWLSHADILVFGTETRLNWLLIASGPITVLPLLAFAFAARRIRLSTLGILQFVGPTMQFLCGVYYGEPFTKAHAICFSLIWIGVAFFVLDGWRASRRASAP